MNASKIIHKFMKRTKPRMPKGDRFSMNMLTGQPFPTTQQRYFAPLKPYENVLSPYSTDMGINYIPQQDRRRDKR